MDGDVRARLADAVAHVMASAKPVVTWGVDDCVMFAAEPIRLVLGFDPVAEWRGAYDDRESAQDAIGELGLGYALRRVARERGWSRVAPRDALAGDVGLVRFGQSITTAVCRAPGWFVMRSVNGYSAVRSKHIRLAWSVL